MPTPPRCQIACPPFMSVGYLEQVLRREREDAAVFTPLPHHYLEIASLLLNTASDDIGELLWGAGGKTGRLVEECVTPRMFFRIHVSYHHRCPLPWGNFYDNDLMAVGTIVPSSNNF